MSRLLQVLSVAKMPEFSRRIQQQNEIATDPYCDRFFDLCDKLYDIWKRDVCDVI